MKKDKVKKEKKEKIDLKGIALFEMAKKHYKKCDEFCAELIEHLKKKYSDANDWVWDKVIEQEEYEELIKCLKGSK